jgi:hypothetical protein
MVATRYLSMPGINHDTMFRFRTSFIGLCGAVMFRFRTYIASVSGALVGPEVQGFVVKHKGLGLVSCLPP